MADLEATLVMLNRLSAEDAHAALRTLGRLVEDLDGAAHDAGFQLEITVHREGPATSAPPL